MPAWASTERIRAAIDNGTETGARVDDVTTIDNAPWGASVIEMGDVA